MTEEEKAQAVSSAMLSAGWHAGRARNLLETCDLSIIHDSKVLYAAQASAHATLALYELEKARLV